MIAYEKVEYMQSKLHFNPWGMFARNGANRSHSYACMPPDQSGFVATCKVGDGCTPICGYTTCLILGNW